MSLEGFLRKKGVKGPRQSYKKRWFALRDQNRIYYYEKKTDTAAKGFIDLKEALSVVPTEPAKKGLFLFQINTPRRIYHLQAESQSAMDYWINGTTEIIRSLSSNEELERVTALLEQANNRIQDLESQLKTSRSGLEHAANKLNLTVDELLADVGKEGGDASAPAQEKKEEAAPAEAAEPSEAKAEEKVEEKAVEEEQKDVEEPTEEPAKEEEPKEEEPKEAEEEKKGAEEKKEEEKAEGEEKKEDAAVAKEDGDDSDSDDEAKAAAPAGASTFGAQVLYDYNARKDYELTIHVNEIITVLSQHENGWWLGCNHAGKQGYFPGSYVRALK